MEKLEALAEKKGCTAGQLAIAWLLHKSPNVIPLFGSKTPKNIESSIAAAHVSLTPEEFQAIDSSFSSSEVFPAYAALSALCSKASKALLCRCLDVVRPGMKQNKTFWPALQAPSRSLGTHSLCTLLASLFADQVSVSSPWLLSIKSVQGPCTCELEFASIHMRYAHVAVLRLPCLPKQVATQLCMLNTDQPILQRFKHKRA